MAIQSFSDKTEVQTSAFEGLYVGLNNGDREALNRVVNEWGFLDVASFIRFAIAVTLKAQNRRLFIEQNGEHTEVTPSTNLLREGN